MSDKRELTTGKEPDAPQLTPAQRQKQRLDAFMGELDRRQAQLGTLLQDSGVDPKRFMEVARRALALDPDLINQDRGALLQAFINAATDGLLPDKRQGAIVVYKGKPQWQPMYQGLLDIAYRSGNFQSIEARVVYEGDFFEYELGDNPFIKHRPRSRPAGTILPIVAAYAVAKTVNGGVFREVFEGDDIRKVNAVSRATNGPGKNWAEEMARKGPVRRMWKYLPKDDRMNRIAESSDMTVDLDAIEVVPEVERKLQPGFAPAQAAITQGADQVIDTEMEEIEDAVLEPISEPQGEATAPLKAREAQMETREQEGPPEPDGAPKLHDTFLQNLLHATSWLNVKQALRTAAKYPEVVMGPYYAAAWNRIMGMKNDGAEIPDFVLSPALFACWLYGSNPSSDQIEGNMRVMRKAPEFVQMKPDEQARFEAMVEEMKS